MSESNGNVTSVLEKTPLTIDDVVSSIVLYAIKGTGSDRDRNITLGVLKQWISENLSGIRVLDNNVVVKVDGDGISCSGQGVDIFHISQTSSRILAPWIEGDTTCHGDVEVTNELTVDKTLHAKQALNVDGNFSVSGSATFSGNFNFSGNFYNGSNNIVFSKPINVRSSIKSLAAEIGADTNKVSIDNGEVVAATGVTSPNIYATRFLRVPVFDATSESEVKAPTSATISATGFVTGCIAVVRNATTSAVTITSSGSGSQSMTIVVQPGECLNYVYSGSTWRHLW